MKQGRKTTRKKRTNTEKLDAEYKKRMTQQKQNQSINLFIKTKRVKRKTELDGNYNIKIYSTILFC